MKQILKKNQIIISVIAIMLIAAGYMNYTSNEKQALETAVLTDSEKYAGIGDATLVSANVTDNNDAQNITDDSTKNEDEIKIDALTKRELEVLKEMAVGKFNRDIAKEMEISERTVKNHISSIFKKLDVTDRTQAAVFAIRNNIIQIR